MSGFSVVVLSLYCMCSGSAALFSGSIAGGFHILPLDKVGSAKVTRLSNHRSKSVSIRSLFCGASGSIFVAMTVGSQFGLELESPCKKASRALQCARSEHICFVSPDLLHFITIDIVQQGSEGASQLSQMGRKCLSRISWSRR